LRGTAYIADNDILQITLNSFYEYLKGIFAAGKCNLSSLYRTHYNFVVQKAGLEN